MAYFTDNFYENVVANKNFMCLDLKGINLKLTGYDSAKIFEVQILKNEESPAIFSTLQIDTWV
jgi:hypothetical protein